MMSYKKELLAILIATLSFGSTWTMENKTEENKTEENKTEENQEFKNLEEKTEKKKIEENKTEKNQEFKNLEENKKIEEEKTEEEKKIEENQKIIKSDIDTKAPIYTHLQSYGTAYLGALTGIASKIIGSFFNLSTSKKVSLDVGFGLIGSGLCCLWDCKNSEKFAAGFASVTALFYGSQLVAPQAKKVSTRFFDFFKKRASSEQKQLNSAFQKN